MRLYTHIGDTTVGATLTQAFDNKELIIKTSWITLTPSEQTLEKDQREAIAILHAIDYFRDHLINVPFLLMTHNPALLELPLNYIRSNALYFDVVYQPKEKNF